MSASHKNPRRPLAGRNFEVLDAEGNTIFIKLLTTPFVLHLETLPIDDLTGIALSAEDFRVIYPTSASGKPIRIILGPPE